MSGWLEREHSFYRPDGELQFLVDLADELADSSEMTEGTL
jgi:hypothetical protein